MKLIFLLEGKIRGTFFFPTCRALLQFQPITIFVDSRNDNRYDALPFNVLLVLYAEIGGIKACELPPP